MTDTPRTDAILTTEDGARIVPHGRWFPQLADLCRELEREVEEVTRSYKTARNLAVERGEEIERVKGALSETLSKWIPMTERAPEDGERVIVFDDDKPFQWVGECSHALIRGEHCFFGGGEGDCHYRVTHWMPLPEAPK